MAYLLILPVLVYTLSDTLGLPLSLGPGLSLKNGVMYLLALILALRIAIRGGYKFEMQTVQVCFALLIAYAFISVLVAGLLIHYDSYKIVASAITLKTTLIDYAVIFGLYFYGTRSVKDSLFIMKAVVIAVTISNAISIGSIEGLINIPGVDTVPGESGRVQGAFGGSNETAALVVCILPLYVAFARARRGLWSLAWICGGLVSITMLLMNVSRGAMVAMLLAYPLAAYSFRKYISGRQVLLWVGGPVVLAGSAFSLVGLHFVTLFLARFVGESGATDVGALSSGRSGIWLRALEKMMSYPITLISGFGWNTYDTMAFHFATHNYYLLLWFEIGLVGLLTFLVLVWRILATVRASVSPAPTEARGPLIAFVFGFGAFLIALFFSGVSQPWPYVWILAGVALRMAICVSGPTRLTQDNGDEGQRAERAFARAADAKRGTAWRRREPPARVGTRAR